MISGSHGARTKISALAQMQHPIHLCRDHPKGHSYDPKVGPPLTETRRLLLPESLNPNHPSYPMPNL
jgi:hypothetical protein